MGYQIVWTDTATDELEEITRYIAGSNPDAAERVATAIVNRVELLATVPYTGSAFPRGGAGKQRVIVSGKYRVFYRVQDESQRVEILLVRHSRRQEPDLPEE